ncbi:MAG: hypothetical protein ACREJD_00870 [Phycisphaerales bacterium]
MTETTPSITSAASFVCPFCGGTTPDQPRCVHCAGPIDPLSRQATQNAMGPWFVRDEQQPFRPGCSYETILNLVARGKITSETILRGPSTSQFWYPAKRVPGVAHKLGVCHSCQQAVTNESECPKCGAVFHADPDRQFLGLMPVRSLPGSPMQAHETTRSPEPAALRPASAPARTQTPRSPTGSNLDSEIARLRRRVAILIGVASGCAIAALVAIWIIASGALLLGGGGEATPLASGGIGAPTVPSRAGRPADGDLIAPSAHETEPPAAVSPASSDRPQEPSNPAPKPDSDARPTEDLAVLRTTRWP